MGCGLSEVLSQGLPGATEENHKNLSQNSLILKHYRYTHCSSIMIKLYISYELAGEDNRIDTNYEQELKISEIDGTNKHGGDIGMLICSTKFHK
jgi:hypothetical protein